MNQMSLLVNGVNDSEIKNIDVSEEYFGAKSAYHAFFSSVEKKMSFILHLLSLVMFNKMCAEHAIQQNVLKVLISIINAPQNDPKEVITQLFSTSV